MWTARARSRDHVPVQAARDFGERFGEQGGEPGLGVRQAQAERENLVDEDVDVRPGHDAVLAPDVFELLRGPTSRRLNRSSVKLTPETVAPCWAATGRMTFRSAALSSTRNFGLRTARSR
jgi:hypothetical protein